MQKSWSVSYLESISSGSLESYCRDIFEDTRIGPDTLPFDLRSDHEWTRELISLIEIGQCDHRSIEYDSDILAQSIEFSCREYLHCFCS